MITLARASSLPLEPVQRPIRTAASLESFRPSENTFLHVESFLPTGVIVSKDSSAFVVIQVAFFSNAFNFSPSLIHTLFFDQLDLGIVIDHTFGEG